MKSALILQRLLVITTLLLASSSALAGPYQTSASASVRISIQKSDFIAVHGIQDLLFDRENPTAVMKADQFRINSSSQLYAVSITSENGKETNTYQLSDGANHINYQVSWGENNTGLQIKINPKQLAELRSRNYTDTLTILIEQG